jgi:hypothetical protein
MKYLGILYVCYALASTTYDEPLRSFCTPEGRYTVLVPALRTA